MTEKTLTTENIKPALDALRGELAPWPVMAMKQDRLNDTQKSAVNSGITSSLVAQIIANTAAIRALESAITGTGLRALVVSSLPAIGTQGILYIVPVTTYDPDTDADVVNYSNEYIWIPVEGGTASEGHYEQVGQTGIVINNGQLNITVNGTSVGTFTANQSGDTTAAITVPTNADYVDKTTAQSIAGVKTFSDGIVSNVTGNVTGDLTGTASKAIADEDGTSIKTGYVNVTGNQTVTGQKTWSDTQTIKGAPPALHLQSTNIQRGVAPASNSNLNLYGKDLNGTELCRLIYRASPTGERRLWLGVNDDYSNGAISPTGTSTWNSLNLYLRADGKAETTFSADLLPATNNAYNLGSSSYQWSSVYAQTYYYNGTEFSNKFVTIDTEQTITSLKTLSTAGSPQLRVKSTSIDLTNTMVTSYRTISIRAIDKNDTTLGQISWNYKASDNTGRLNLTQTSRDGVLGGVIIQHNGSNSTTNIMPYDTTNDHNLGTSTNQWSSVYAQTYYYNGTQWGLDQNNIWTGENTFSSILKQVNSTITKGTIPQSNTTAFGVYWGGTGVSSLNNALFAQRGYVNVDGSTTYTLYALENATGGTQTQLSLKYDPNDTIKRYAYLRGDFRPYADNSFNLGTSTNKWKTLNGINPGALSLPNINTSIAVDTTNWVYDGATFNEIKINNATQTISGWLYIIINNASSDDVIVVRYAGSGSDNLTYAQYKSGLSYVSLVSPIMPGVKTYVASRKAFSTIKIYHSLGNV